jgi:SAM-dependent methyltransferase
MIENKKLLMLKALVSPRSHLSLCMVNDELSDSQGNSYEFMGSSKNVVDFMKPCAISADDKLNLDAYDSDQSIDVYRNFLEWLFLTFNTNEADFRSQILNPLHLEDGQKVLIVGCGLGEDIPFVIEKIGDAGELHVQDISKAMVMESADRHKFSNVLFTISNANMLPYASNYFDAVFHFGGINLFGDIRVAISELDRVCKNGGRVVFGDEGIADHLIGTEYYEIAVCNNRLWAKKPPMGDLPYGANNIQLNYILGNCFYLVSFTSGSDFPSMNIDVQHKGLRGGSARTRYFGQLEGVTEGTKLRMQEQAKNLNISIHELLELMLDTRLSAFQDNLKL